MTRQGPLFYKLIRCSRWATTYSAGATGISPPGRRSLAHHLMAVPKALFGDHLAHLHEIGLALELLSDSVLHQGAHAVLHRERLNLIGRAFVIDQFLDAAARDQ